ncbi:hypothetical protein MTP06_45460 [Streptomyces sp. PLM4]|nr:hypothetical protein MTP06_45460 [Streptomyces sp. PLM4]
MASIMCSPHPSTEFLAGVVPVNVRRIVTGVRFRPSGSSLPGWAGGLASSAGRADRGVLVCADLAVKDGLKRRPGWVCAPVRCDLAVKDGLNAGRAVGSPAGA